MESVKNTEGRKVFSPPMDIVDKKDSLVVTMDIPGADPHGIEIALDGDHLTVKAKVKPLEIGDLPLIYAEYEVGDYETTLRISEVVEREKIEAAFKDGVLTLTMPKVAEAKPRQIKVRAA